MIIIFRTFIECEILLQTFQRSPKSPIATCAIQHFYISFAWKYYRVPFWCRTEYKVNSLVVDSDPFQSVNEIFCKAYSKGASRLNLLFYPPATFSAHLSSSQKFLFKSLWISLLTGQLWRDSTLILIRIDVATPIGNISSIPNAFWKATVRLFHWI